METEYGIIQEDINFGTLIGYLINGMVVPRSYEQIAKENVGKNVQYEVSYEGYRKYGMFTKEFYKGIGKIII